MREREIVMDSGNGRGRRDSVCSLNSASLFLAILLVVTSCAGLSHRREKELTAPPHSTREECVDLDRDETLEYVFRASHPLDFNIHFHGRNGIQYPLSRQGIRSEEGSFRPADEGFQSPVRQTYCLTWDNKSSDHVTLYYNFVVK